MKKSHLLALTVVVLLAAYFVISGLVRGSGASDVATASTVDSAAAQGQTQPPAVVVRESRSQAHVQTLTLKGVTEAARSVVVRSETVGAVTATPAIEGAFVRKGALLCRLDVQARQAIRDQAAAQVRSAELDYNAASRLAEQGWRAPTQAAAAKAVLDGARAALAQAEIELERMSIRAPFDGVFERRDAEVGDFLSPGGACGLVVELDPLLIVAEAAERYADLIRAGASATATLADGRVIDGEIRFVSRNADPRTRTFRVEMLADNPDNSVAAGLSATLRLAGPSVEAHVISPAVLTLNDAGDVGVRIVEGETARFAAVDLVDDGPQGAWVVGLPDTVDLIVVGQELVADGMRVSATRQDAR